MHVAAVVVGFRLLCFQSPRFQGQSLSSLVQVVQTVQ
jgi:hypothetical protein